MRVATILHIEDDDAMALAFRAAIEAVSLHAIVYRVSSGEAALAYLRGEGRYASRSWPDIAYVDLNMPKVDGWQVLVEMRADSELRSIPVVVVTASSRREDRDRAHALGRTSRSQPLLARCGGCYPINVSIAGA